MSNDSLATDKDAYLPWLMEPTAVEPDEWHLVVLWFHAEPDRVGQSAVVEPNGSWLGRPDDAQATDADEPLLVFGEQRPGVTSPKPPLQATALSRRQCRLQPADDETLHVENHGHRTLRHNGSLVSECLVRAGDTLRIEHVALLRVERRPRTLPPLTYYAAPPFPFGHPDSTGIVGESPATWKLREQLAIAALSGGHVLLLGETGTGKELAAGAVHALSRRANGPLIRRNAATLPEGLLDAELFGQARNYPNAGSPERAGLIEAADGGRLFLDEIGELPEAHQAHLLRVLDEGGQIHRLGETRERYVDVRLVAATNRDPACLKPDFLARFVVRVELTALRDHPSDVPLLIRALLAERRSARDPLVARFFPDDHPARPFIDPELIDALVRSPLPENARGLGRAIWLSATSSPAAHLALTADVRATLHAKPAPTSQRDSTRPPRRAASSISPEQIRQALTAADGNLERAATQLGVSRRTLGRLIEQQREAE